MVSERRRCKERRRISFLSIVLQFVARCAKTFHRRPLTVENIFDNLWLLLLCDICLLASLHEKNIHVATLTSWVAQTALIDCLYVLLASRGVEGFRKATTLIEAELSRVLRIASPTVHKKKSPLTTWRILRCLMHYPYQKRRTIQSQPE